MKVEINKVTTLTGHRDSVYALQDASDARIFSAGGDGMAVEWNLHDPENGTLVAKVPNSIYALKYLREKNTLIVGQNQEGIHLIDCHSRKEIGSIKLTASQIFDIQTSGDRGLIACGDGELIVVNLSNLKVERRLKHSHDRARCVAVNEEKREFSVGYSDNFIRVFDLQSYDLKQEWSAHNNSVFCLCYDQSGRILLSGSRDAHLKTWNSMDDYSLKSDVIAHMYTINHAAFSPDNKHFVTCSMDKSIKVWSFEEMRLLKVIDKARHAGHGTSVNKLLWSAFNNQVISASDDRTISIWQPFFKLNTHH